MTGKNEHKRPPSRQRQRALEAYLVAASRTGDRRALGQLVALASPGLLAHAARLLGSRSQAEDAVQAAWIDILGDLSRLSDDAAFRPWAMRIVSRKAARMIRGLQKDRKLASAYAVEQQGEGDEAEGPEVADAATVRRIIDRLDPAHRATLALFYLEDMSVAEVAVALDIPIGTVKTRLMHARLKLRAILEGEDHEQD